MTEKFAWVTAIGSSMYAPVAHIVVAKLPALARVVGAEGNYLIVAFLPEYRGSDDRFGNWRLRRKDGDQWRTHTLETLPSAACAALMREALTHETR